MPMIEITSFAQFTSMFTDHDGLIRFREMPRGEGRAVACFVFRGQSTENWPLESTFQRLLRRAQEKTDAALDPEEVLERHLKSFSYFLRGRRGANPAKLSQNDLWALGQHFGLATPLLDWTTSPYVALFFALIEKGHQDSVPAVWCLDKNHIEENQHRALTLLAHENFPIQDDDRKVSSDDRYENATKRDRFPSENKMSFVVPDLDENQRLLAQSGLFTQHNISYSLQQWRDMVFPNEDVLKRVRIVFSEDERLAAIRQLNLMNINHSALFPDISGTCSHVNLLTENSS